MKLKSIAALLALGCAVSAASAANVSLTGEFTHDNDVQQFVFTVAAPSLVGLRSWSYAGGINGDGTTIARGGFDPIIALFNASGLRIGEQDDANCATVASDLVTAQCWDIRYSAQLAAGTYIATLQQYDNFSNGALAAGFVYDGAQHQSFRNGFVDAMGDQRSGSWALDISNVASASLAKANVPEPASSVLAGMGLLGLFAARRRRQG